MIFRGRRLILGGAAAAVHRQLLELRALEATEVEVRAQRAQSQQPVAQPTREAEAAVLMLEEILHKELDYLAAQVVVVAIG